MTTISKEDAQARIWAAGEGCNEVQTSIHAAYTTLGGNVFVDGYGIYRDPLCGS